MLKQIKNLGLVLVIGTTMLTAIGCEDTTTELENYEPATTQEETVEKEEVKEETKKEEKETIKAKDIDLNNLVLNLLEDLDIDFKEGYNKYENEMTEEEYATMMTEDVMDIIYETMLEQGIEITEEEFYTDPIKTFIYIEITNDVFDPHETAVQDAIDDMNEGIINDMNEQKEANEKANEEATTKEEATDMLAQYVVENFPEGYTLDETGTNGITVYGNVLNNEGHIEGWVEFEYGSNNINYYEN